MFGNYPGIAVLQGGEDVNFMVTIDTNLQFLVNFRLVHIVVIIVIIVQL